MSKKNWVICRKSVFFNQNNKSIRIAINVRKLKSAQWTTINGIKINQSWAFGDITCPLAFMLGITGALRSLHCTCFNFLPSSTSFIMSDQSGRLRGRLFSASNFCAFSLEIGLRTTAIEQKNKNKNKKNQNIILVQSSSIRKTKRNVSFLRTNLLCRSNLNNKLKLTEIFLIFSRKMMCL